MWREGEGRIGGLTYLFFGRNTSNEHTNYVALMIGSYLARVDQLSVYSLINVRNRTALTPCRSQPSIFIV